MIPVRAGLPGREIEVYDSLPDRYFASPDPLLQRLAP
jgi:hypothetical protein